MFRGKYLLILVLVGIVLVSGCAQQNPPKEELTAQDVQDILNQNKDKLADLTSIDRVIVIKVIVTEELQLAAATVSFGDSTGDKRNNFIALVVDKNNNPVTDAVASFYTTAESVSEPVSAGIANFQITSAEPVVITSIGISVSSNDDTKSGSTANISNFGLTIDGVGNFAVEPIPLS